LHTSRINLLWYNVMSIFFFHKYMKHPRCLHLNVCKQNMCQSCLLIHIYLLYLDIQVKIFHNLLQGKQKPFTDTVVEHNISKFLNYSIWHNTTMVSISIICITPSRTAMQKKKSSHYGWHCSTSVNESDTGPSTYNLGA
jgi:hypothetical protein